MWTVVAVLTAWSVASLAVAMLLGGVIALRRRDTALEAGRVHSLDGTDSRLAIPAFVS